VFLWYCFVVIIPQELLT